MRKFDHADYAANPGKYRLFKTADMATTLFANNEPDLPADTPVGLTFFADAYNGVYRRTMPVYTLHTGHQVFATALKNFVL